MVALGLLFDCCGDQVTWWGWLFCNHVMRDGDSNTALKNETKRDRHTSGSIG